MIIIVVNNHNNNDAIESDHTNKTNFLLTAMNMAWSPAGLTVIQVKRGTLT